MSEENTGPEEDKKLDEEVPVSPTKPTHNTELKSSPIIKIHDDQPTSEQINQRILSLLNVNIAELTKLNENYPKMDATAGDIGEAWFSAYQQGINNTHKGDSFSETLARADALWKQKLEIDGEELGVARAGSSRSSGNDVLSGERALARVVSTLNLGATVQIPLYHTGIWVTIKPPSEAALLQLERRIANEKITLGRLTRGMVFSNTRVYASHHVVNFALNHIQDSTAKKISVESLKNTILCTDIPSLIWGLACAIYPSGYKYVRPCTNNPAKCQHLESGDINISKLFWVDNESLTATQKRHMSRRTDKLTDEEIRQYQAEHVRGGPLTVNVNSDLRIRFRTPTINQYENSGFRWVDNIVQMTEEAFGTSLVGDERQDYIVDQGAMTALRTYGHWIDRIFIGEDTIKDEETIDQVLDQLSSNKPILDTFFEQVGKYIDNAAVALIAIPKYDCPNCGETQRGDIHQETHPNLLAIDALRTFFILLDQNIFKALTDRKLEKA